MLKFDQMNQVIILGGIHILRHPHGGRGGSQNDDILWHGGRGGSQNDDVIKKRGFFAQFWLPMPNKKGIFFHEIQIIQKYFIFIFSYEEFY